MTDAEVFAWAVGRLHHLIGLVRPPEDPNAVLLGEEIGGLSEDEAQSLLMAAVIALAGRNQQGETP